MAEKNKPEAPIVAFKGFSPDWKCRDMQFAVGGTYTHKGRVVACESGLHACEYPLDVWSYYPPVTDAGVSRYALVEASGEIARHDADSKVASAKLTIKAELRIPEMVTHAVAWIMDRIDATKAEGGSRSAATNTGDRSAASVEGRSSVAVATGCHSRAKASTGSAIVLCYRNEDGDLIHIRAGIAGQDIGADAWYSLDENGEFVKEAA